MFSARVIDHVVPVVLDVVLATQDADATVAVPGACSSCLTTAGIAGPGSCRDDITPFHGAMWKSSFNFEIMLDGPSEGAGTSSRAFLNLCWTLPDIVSQELKMYA